MRDHTHALPGAEATFPWGSYTVAGEGRLPYGKREILYIVGILTAGSVCCGAIECRLIHVPGLVISWQHERDEASGNPKSLVEPVTDAAARKDIEQLILRKFPSSLVVLES